MSRRSGAPGSRTQPGGDSRGEAVSAAEAAARPEGSPLDPEVLGQLREADREDGSGFLAALIDKFLQEAPAQISALRHAVSGADAASAAKAAHALKGSVGAVGATAMAAACGELEALGRGGSVAGAGPHLARIEHEFERVRKALEAERRARAPKRRAG